MAQKIGIGSDHAGYALKERIKTKLQAQGLEVKDYGTDSEESVDYPDFIHPLATDVEKGNQELGIIICGSANGVAMTANKHQGIRAAIAWNKELAELGRSHNDANVLALPARFIDEETAFGAVDGFLGSQFEGGRHQRRVDKISC